MRNAERVLLIAAAIALALYATFLRRNLSFAVGGPDTGGYFNEARLIATGHLTRPVELVRLLGLDDSWLGFFMPLGFAPSRGGSMHPLYPPGLPIHLAAVGVIGGWKHAPFYVTPLAAIGCLILMVAVGRRLGIPLLLTFPGAICMAALPPFLWHAVQPASDVLATFWALLAIWLALGIERRPSAAVAVAAGVVFAIGVWVRPTNTLMLFPLALAVRLRWRPLAAMAAGALPFGVTLMMWSAKLYGSPFRTGYGAVDLTWAGAKFAAPQHAEWLMRMATPLVFPCGLLVIFDRRVGLWIRSMLVVWFTVFFVYYAFYGFFDGWLCLRFLLPAIPALLFGVQLLMRDLVALARGRMRIATVAIATAMAFWICIAPVKSIFRQNVLPVLGTMETGYPHHVRWAESHLPKRSIVITGVMSGAFLYYSNRSIVRYDQLTDDRFQLLRAYTGNLGLPWYAVVSSTEITYDELQRRFRGHWTPVDTMDDLTIYRLDS